MLKAKDLRDQSQEELQATINDTQKELYDLVGQFKLTNKMEKPHLLRQKRRDLARLLTVLRDKKGS
jgi:large subunit ribosomal protein L29